MLYATKGKIIAVIAKDYKHNKIITRIYDCSKTKPKLKLQTEKGSIAKAKSYLYNKFHLQDFNCLAPATFVTKEAKKRFLKKIKETCKELC